MLCKRTLCRRNFHQFVAFTTPTVTNCKRTLRIQLQIISVHCACDYKLLAYTAHAVTKIKRPMSNPSVKNFFFFFQPSSQDVATLRYVATLHYLYRLHDKKSLKSKTSKSHTWAPVRPAQFSINQSIKISNKV
jgi:hypothetical protein